MMTAVYLIFALQYPIYLGIILKNQPDVDIEADYTKPYLHEIFLPEECFTVIFPIIIVFGIHILAVLPQLLCKFQRKLEITILVLLIIHFWYEIVRYQAMDLD